MAVEVRLGHVSEAAITIKGELAVSDARAEHSGEAVTIYVYVVDAEARGVDVEGAVLLNRVAVGGCDGRVVNSVDGEGDGGELRASATWVDRLIGEAGGAVEVSHRREGEAAVRLNCHHTRREGGVLNKLCGESGRIIVDVGVVDEQANGRVDDEGLILIGAEGVDHAHRRVIHSGHGEVHGGLVRDEHAVVYLVGEAIGAVVVGDRGVAERAVVVEVHLTVCRLGDHRGGEALSADRLVVNVEVVDEQAATYVDSEGCVLVAHVLRLLARSGVVDGHRRVSGVAEGDGDGGRIRVGVILVAGHILEARLTVEVGRRLKAEATVSVDGSCAAHLRAGHEVRGEGVVEVYVHVVVEDAVAGRHSEGDLLGATHEAVALSARRVVDGGKGEGHEALTRARASGVGDEVTEGSVAVEVSVRLKAEAAITVKGDGAVGG